MTGLRALLACLWLLFGLTATAHADIRPASEPPCHLQTGAMATNPIQDQHHLPDKAAMPCCSQPAIVLPAQAFAPVMQTQPVQLSPQPTVILSGLSVSFEPRPPKIV